MVYQAFKLKLLNQLYMKLVKLIVIAIILYINVYLLSNVQQLTNHIGLLGVVLFDVGVLIAGFYILYLLNFFKSNE